MNSSANNVTSRSKQLILAQLAVVVFAVIIAFIVKGQWAALSALYGGFIVLVSSLLMTRGMASAQASAIHSPKRSIGMLYLNAVLRFVLVLVLFVIGLGMFKLDALVTVLGFIATQLAFLIMMRAPRNKGA